MTGYFGKVVTHGDFVMRRLPPAFVAGWDRWLQAGLAHSRAELGPRWLDAYLNSPVWHFALGAGVCGTDPMAGVLIPGVDRAGRYFPLTLAGVVADGDAGLLAALCGHGAAWFDELAALALGSLGSGFALADMDAALAAMAPARAPRCGGALEGRAVFWTAGALCMGPTWIVDAALPSPATFCAMLAGS